MKGISRLENESLIDFADRMANLYSQTSSKTTKKGKGQFFTKRPIAKYMAQLATTNKETVSILDPGAGVGILSAALIERLLCQKNIKKIDLVCYETDKEAVPYLKAVLEEASRDANKNASFTYNLKNQDFIESNANIFPPNLVSPLTQNSTYDIIIANPPYFKLNKAKVPACFADVVSGQPNIYFLFMALSAKLLKEKGEMIFITPRSFCSGLYYSKFRSWLIQQVEFADIHLFGSRKELFSSDKVLQENIITRFIKGNPTEIIVSKTQNGDFSDIQTIKAQKNDIIYRSNGHIFFRIPSNEEELDIVRKLDKLPDNFYKLGLKISTGKVVAFRNKPYLQKEIRKDSVPLLWMHNIRKGAIEWPIEKGSKAIALKNSPETKALLIPAGNYLVLKRFTTKEQKKRFETAYISKNEFKEYNYFALDNMINYIHCPQKEINKNQLKGIARYLDFPIVESYFRILNGHTQVNANEVYALPFPALEILEKLGVDKDINIQQVLSEGTK